MRLKIIYSVKVSIYGDNVK